MFPRLSSRDGWDSRSGNNCFPREQSLSLYCFTLKKVNQVSLRNKSQIRPSLTSKKEFQITWGKYTANGKIGNWGGKKVPTTSLPHASGSVS